MTGSNDKGFTLIELMVGLVLLGLISAAIAGTVHSGVLGSEAVEARSIRTNQIAFSQAFIRRHLEAARPLRLADVRTPQAAFIGNPNQIHFVSVMPDWIGQGGSHRVNIRQVGSQLIFSAQRSNTNIEQLTVRRPTAETALVDGVRALEIAYYGRQGRDPELHWQKNWTERARLPRLIRIRVGFADQSPISWPELMIAPRLALAPR